VPTVGDMKTPLLFVCGALLLTSSGCIGPAADVAANGLVLGGATDPAFAGLAQTFEAGVVLARPLSLTDLQSNLVSDADAVWLSLDGAPVELRGEDNGLYLYDSSVQPGVRYSPGTRVEVHAHVDGREGIATVVAPPAPDLSGLPLVHTSGTSLVVDLGEEFALAYGVVIDAQGYVVWDDRPQTTEAVIRELADTSPVERYLFPPEAFLDRGAAYGIAILGIRAADSPDFDGFERFWSNFGVGAIGTGAITTAP
jgi:hypothetical protein